MTADVAPDAAAAGARAPLLAAIDVHRRYLLGRSRRDGQRIAVDALRGVSLTVERGEHLAIVGASGSGKSTLLNLLGALDRPTHGEIRYRGRDVRTMSDHELATLRNQRIGFVFQSFHLLARQSARDNVALPLVYRSTSRAERKTRALAALDAVGLADRVAHRPSELSGGQQQRVAIARALVTEPDLLLADEPTGNLDTGTGEEVMGLLERLHRERDMALVVITHEHDIAAHADRVITLRDGTIVDAAGAPPAGRKPA